MARGLLKPLSVMIKIVFIDDEAEEWDEDEEN